MQDESNLANIVDYASPPSSVRRTWPVSFSLGCSIVCAAWPLVAITFLVNVDIDSTTIESIATTVAFSVPVAIALGLLSSIVSMIDSRTRRTRLIAVAGLLIQAFWIIYLAMRVSYPR